MRARGPEGTRVRYTQTGRAQVVKTGGAQWSDEAEEKFFDVLAATCNVRLSAAEVGFTTFTVYRQRRLRADFAERWRAALAQGYARLEMALVEAAADSMEGVEFDADRPIPQMTAAEAMNLLKLHRADVNGGKPGRPGQFAKPRSLDELRDGIVRKIEAIRAVYGDA